MPSSVTHKLMLTAVQHHQAGKLAEAEAIYRQVLLKEPRNADALHLLGVLAHQSQRPQVAIDLIQKAIAIRPEAEFYLNGAEALRAMGRDAEAIEYLKKVIKLDPRLPEGHNNLGTAYSDIGKLNEAVAALNEALRLRPNYDAAITNLANAMERLGRGDEALKLHRQAAQINPNSAAALTNLGNVLQKSGDLDQAALLLRRAITLRPDMSQAHNNLANTLLECGLVEEAIAEFKQTLALQPNDSSAHSNLLFALYRQPTSTPQSLFEAHRQWAIKHAEPLSAHTKAHTNDRSPGRRLRLGYVSPDFLNHPVGRFLVPVFERHDHQNFEIVCYSDVRGEDVMTQRLRACAHEWHSTATLNDVELAEKIRADRIDVLIDLVLHAARNRLLCFARRPAPVQATYLAYAGTSGMTAMDWRITDSYLDPPGTDGNYSEKSIRVQSYWCYEPPPEAPEVAPLPARSSGHITFGCLNNFSKIRPETMEVWARIVQAVPGSRLLLHCRLGSHRARVIGTFEKLGLGADRLEFADYLPAGHYLNTYNRIDIGLDPYPFNGGTTTCDALWMGVPMVTLAGNFAVARAGVTLLSNVGLPELIARTPQQYVEIATQLARDIDRIAELRAGLRGRMAQSPLCDADACTQQLEIAYRTMWETWCQS